MIWLCFTLLRCPYLDKAAQILGARWPWRLKLSRERFRIFFLLWPIKNEHFLLFLPFSLPFSILISFPLPFISSLSLLFARSVAIPLLSSSFPPHHHIEAVPCRLLRSSSATLSHDLQCSSFLSHPFYLSVLSSFLSPYSSDRASGHYMSVSACNSKM